MPGETEQQYVAWLLYCELGSLRKLHEVWNKLGQLSDNISTDFVYHLGKKPVLATLGNWSKRYRWPERRDLRLEQELVELKDKADRFIKKRKYLVTDLLISKLGKLQRQARTESTNVPEVRSLWEMHRTEFGESTGRSDVSHHINEAEQYPPTQDEIELGREIDELIKRHYDKKR